jgi:GNAT superfamily N-acetyltransferase
MNMTSKNVKVIALDPKDDREAWNLLARAFFNYPFMTYFQPDPAKREKSLAWYLGFTIRIGRKCGRILSTPEMEGVAIWLPPKACWVSTIQLIKTGMVAIPFRMGLKTCKRILANDHYIEAIRKKMAPKEHWYLWAVGVDPAYKHRGIGSALLKPILMEADKHGEVCYLETHLPANLPWYEKHGFEIVLEGEIPGYSVPVWAMMRHPQ